MGEDLDDEEGGGKKGGGKKVLLILVLLVLLLTGGAAAAYFTGMLQPVLDMILGAETQQEEVTEIEDIPDPIGTAFIDLPEMLVNMGAGRGNSFLKIRVSLELAREGDLEYVESLMPRIEDNFQIYLRELRPEDLQGQDGVYRLREELLNRVNVAAAPARIRDVLFKEMLVQ